MGSIEIPAILNGDGTVTITLRIEQYEELKRDLELLNRRRIYTRNYMAQKRVEESREERKCGRRPKQILKLNLTPTRGPLGAPMGNSSGAVTPGAPRTNSPTSNGDSREEQISPRLVVSCGNQPFGQTPVSAH